jgi:hypothetical protein
MQITPPFGYTAIIPLTREHRVRPTAPGWVPPLLRTVATLPTSVGEFAAAGRDYPIVFTPEGATFAPMLVLGLALGENLFAHGEQWAAGVYLPAYLRRFPFCTATVRVGGTMQDERVICVDAGSLASDGEPVFATGEADSPTVQHWQGVQQQLREFDADWQRSAHLGTLLARYDLLEPFTVRVTPEGGEPLTVSGMLRVAETRLETLPEAALRELIKSGGLAAIYAHLNSLQQFGRLLDLHQARSRATSAKV